MQNDWQNWESHHFATCNGKCGSGKNQQWMLKA